MRPIPDQLPQSRWNDQAPHSACTASWKVRGGSSGTFCITDSISRSRICADGGTLAIFALRPST